MHGPAPEQKCSEAGLKRHCSVLEQYQYPFRYYLYCIQTLTASEVGVYFNTCCTADVPLHHWRLLISGRSFACMEQSAV